MADEFLVNAPFDDRFPAKAKAGLLADLPDDAEGLGDLYYATDTGILYIGLADLTWIGLNNYITAALIRTAFGAFGWANKGTLLVDSGVGLQDLQVGLAADGDVLTVDDAEPLGLKWATPSGGGGGGTLDGLTDVAAASPALGAIIAFNDTSGNWEKFGNSDSNPDSVMVTDPAGATGFTMLPFMLQVLMDVDDTGLTTGNVPTWNGTNFEMDTPIAGGVGVFSGVWGYRSGSAQSIAGATDVPIEWDGEIYDTNTYHDNSTNPSRMTAPGNGYYIITTQVRRDIMSLGSELKILGSMGGGTVLARTEFDGLEDHVQITTGPVYFSSGQYAEVVLNYTSPGSGVVVSSGANWCKMYLMGT